MSAAPIDAKKLQTQIAETLLRNYEILCASVDSAPGVELTRAMLISVAANLAQAYAPLIHRDDCDALEPCGECRCRDKNEAWRAENLGPSSTNY